MTLTRSLLSTCLFLWVAYAFNSAIAQDTEFGLNASTYFGDISGNESVYGMAYQSDGTLVVAVNAGPLTPAGVSPLYLNGATDNSPGTILRLTGDGETVLSLTRLSGAVYDLSVDAADNLLVAAGTDGLMRLNPVANSVLATALAGSFVYRADSAGDGHAVALVPGNPGDPDQKSGKGMIHLFDAALTELNSFEGAYANTTDVAIEGPSETIFMIGWSNKSTWGGVDYGPSTPVDVPGLSAVPYGYNPAGGINARWAGYNWSSKVWLDAEKTIPNPDYLNYPFSTDPSNLTEDRYPIVQSNNMADSRGYRVVMGADGNLYSAFEYDGGNTPFRWSPTDLTVAKDPVGGDIFHQTFNTSTVPKVFFGRYDPSTGEVLRSQWYTNRLYSSVGPPKDNTVRMKGGSLRADEQGRVFIGGTSAYGLPLPGNQVYSPNPGETTFNPFLPTEYVGGAYLMAYSPDFATRLYTTRLATGGNTRAIAARLIGSEPWPRIAWGGAANLNFPLYTAKPVQPQPGYGDSDATIAVLGGSLSDADGFEFVADFTSGYATTNLNLRSQTPTSSPVDADGDGLIDDSRIGYALILPTGDVPAETPFSPLSGYTGPAFYGGFFTNWLDSATSTLEDKKVDTDEIAIRTKPDDGVVATHQGVIFFPRSEFSGIAPTDVLTFGAGDRMKLTGPDWGAGAQVRFLIREGSDYFVSESVLSSEGSLQLLYDVEDGNWAQWSIPEDMDFAPDAAVFESRNFANITGAGMIIDTPVPSGERFFFRLRRFEVSLQVNANDNLPPVPGFSVSPRRGQVPLAVTFDSNPSSDPDGSINFVSWSFGDGERIGGNVVTHDYMAAGNYLPVVTVFDDDVAKKALSGQVDTWFGLSADPDSIFASFGGDSVDVSEDFPRGFKTLLDLDGDLADDDYLKGHSFSATEPITTSDVRGTALYGGLALQSIDGEASFAERRIKNTGNPDEIGIRMQAEDAPGGALVRGLLYLDKSGFLGPARTEPVTFGPGSGFKVRTTARWDALGTARWLIRDGTTFHVSETPASITSRMTASLEFTSATDHGRWAVYDPAANPNLDFDQAAALYESRQFTDVTAIGLFFERDTYEGSRVWLTIDAMEATGVIGTITEATYADWLDLWFTPAELADPALESTLWGAIADPDMDGENALEMLLMGNPEAFDLPGLIDAQADGIDLVLTFNLRKAVNGLPWPAAFLIEDSLDLLPGSWLTAFESSFCDLAGPVCTQGDVTYTVLEEFADYRRVRVRLPVTTARFVRIRVP
ncbi:MAG: PKD domain-containing protein [Oceanipulchritudo sp.]